MRAPHTKGHSCFVVLSCLLGALSLSHVSACNSSDGEVAPYRLTPRAVVEPTGNDTGSWALFDRDTVNGWVPALDTDGRADVSLTLDASSSITALKVFGSSPYRVSLLTANQQLLAGPYNLAELGPQWNSFPLSNTHGRSSVLLRFEHTQGAEAPVPEIELWGNTATLPQMWQPSESYEDDIPSALADVVTAQTRSQIIGQAAADGAVCTSFELQLTRHPSAYRRAWLRYQTDGVFRPFVLTRAVNDGAMTRGHWVAASDASTFVHRVDPERLAQGRNDVHFCIPGEARSTIEISAVELIGELDHGSNIIESASVAPYDGVPSSSASILLEDSDESILVAPDQELVVAFDRLIAPEVVEIAADTDWTIRCVGISGDMHQLTGTPIQHGSVTEGAYAIDGGERERCAGLRLRPSSQTNVSGIRVFGSGSGRRIDFPRIVLASDREHFGHRAWVDGWATSPSEVGGGVRIAIDEVAQETEVGVFGAMLQRPANETGDWPVSITAILADGETFTRHFVLDREVTGVPGLSDGGSIDDGLTDEERAERFGEVGQTVEVEFRNGNGARVQLGTDVYVDVPPGALQRNSTISVTHLDALQLPPLDPGLINVTAPAARGYEFLPHGQQFRQVLDITLPYQESLIPSGYVPGDVQTFYYDEELERWEPLTRREVERGPSNPKVVRSLTDHFTVMINAIVVSPEHPQASSFNPNRLSGIKAATPAERVSLIAPPQATPYGDAGLSYPLDIPPGRLGVQPSLALTYNSSSGNGWLGVGWDLSVPSIGIDTRWGVPRYTHAVETETYTIGGQQLSPTAHREQPKPRAQGTVQLNGRTAKIFRPRIEGDFQRIARYGNGPKQYWWEVTDRNGIRSFYGGTPETGKEDSATLADDAGNIYRWALREIRDTHGNRVRFDCEEVTWTPPLPGGVSGRELYLSSVHYTLSSGQSSAPYRVVMLREEGRPDVIVSGRGGFKQATAERLRRVEVYYRNVLVRAWNLAYDQGPFSKSRLRSVTQFGVDNQPFPGNSHRFEYFDEVTQSSSVYTGFASGETWGGNQEEPDIGTVLPEEFFEFVGEADPTVLGGSRTREGGPHLYIGFSPGRTTKASLLRRESRRSFQRNRWTRRSSRHRRRQSPRPRIQEFRSLLLQS